MGLIESELPFTNEALQIYIDKAIERLKQLHPVYLEIKRLKRRLKTARERLAKHRA